MITATKLRANLYSVFRIAKVTTVGFEVVHDNRVYDLTITPTDKKPKIIRTYRKRKRGVRGLVSLDNCPACGELAVAGVCLNKRCTNSRLN